VPGGAHEHQLDTGHRQAPQPRHQDQVLDEGLWPLPASSRLHPVTQGVPASDHHGPPHAQYEALRAAREREQTEAYAAEYARRAGVEGTLSQAVRRAGLRRSRYVGLARTHLGHILAATAINFVRIGEWLAGTPRAKTRRPRFATVLAPAAAA
jgi:hypothetical protein